ncbi:MAG: cysteine--tRNA ligase, partial [Spirochaetaceae bacterium]
GDAAAGDAAAAAAVAGKRLGEQASSRLAAFEEHLGDDLNVPRCLADLWGVVKDDELTPSEKLDLIARMDRVFGLDLLEAQASTDTSLLEEDIRTLVEERTEARKNKNFARADEIRDMLAERGIILEDTPDGTRWKKL